MRKCDSLDINILNELRINARISNAEIGRRIGLTGAAVGERIEKMEFDGIIQGYSTALNYDKLDLSVRVLVMFKAQKITHAEMVKMVKGMPEIIEWYTITGNNCMCLKVAVRTTLHLEVFLEKLQQFGETSTSIILTNTLVKDHTLNELMAASKKDVSNGT